MDDKLYVADIVYGTSTDGLGLRNSLYVSGCNLRCKGCHNSHWWPLKSGKLMSVNEVYDKLKTDNYNVSILGGEPLMQVGAVTKLCRMIKRYRPHINIWLYTGYEKEVLEIWYPQLLDNIDVLVDGPFVQELKNEELRFRGSQNQGVWVVNHNHSLYSFVPLEDF